HQRQLQPVEFLARHRHADHAARVPDREREQRGRRLARGEDDIALVLAVRGIDHHHGPASSNVLDRTLDGVQNHPIDLLALHRCSPPASRRSTYLAITSTSMFTWSPTEATPSVVRARVSGIRLTSNQCSAPGCGLNAETVRLMPSTATDPFSAR